MRKGSKMSPLIWGLVPVFLCFACAHPVPRVPVPPAAGPEPTAPIEPTRAVVPPLQPGAIPEQIVESQRLQYENDLAHERAMIEYRRASADFQRRHDEWESERNAHQSAVDDNRRREGRTEGGLGTGNVVGIVVLGVVLAAGIPAVVWAIAESSDNE